MTCSGFILPPNHWFWGNIDMQFSFLYMAPILYHKLFSSSIEDLSKNCLEAENIIIRLFKGLKAEYVTGRDGMNYWRATILWELWRDLLIHCFLQLKLAISYRKKQLFVFLHNGEILLCLCGLQMNLLMHIHFSLWFAPVLEIVLEQTTRKQNGVIRSSLFLRTQFFTPSISCQIDPVP